MQHQYKANITWDRNGREFTVKTYDRTYSISLGSSTSIKASAAPEFMGSPELANPEELFTASISSCLMLSYLHLAAMKNVIVNEYHSESIGTLSKNVEGKLAITEVVVKPRIIFQEEDKVSTALREELIKKAHATCFISSSVKTNVVIEPSYRSSR